MLRGLLPNLLTSVSFCQVFSSHLRHLRQARVHPRVHLGHLVLPAVMVVHPAVLCLELALAMLKLVLLLCLFLALPLAPPFPGRREDVVLFLEATLVEAALMVPVLWALRKGVALLAEAISMVVAPQALLALVLSAAVVALLAHVVDQKNVAPLVVATAVVIALLVVAPAPTVARHAAAGHGPAKQ